MAATGKLRGAALAVLVSFGLAASPATAQDLSGAEQFELCAQCHGAAGEGNPVVLAPAIAGLQSWYVTAQLTKFRSGLRGTHPEDVAGLLIDGSGRGKFATKITAHSLVLRPLPGKDIQNVLFTGWHSIDAWSMSSAQNSQR